MGKFLPEGSQITRFNNNPTTLEGVVSQLPPKAKQAMFSAASHGLIERGTWVGCAFNKAGSELGGQVFGEKAAAAFFGCDEAVVTRFIRVWDGLPGSKVQATAALREAIEKVGLFTEPNFGKRLAYTVRSRVFTSYETKMREEFEASNAVAPIEGAAEIAELLSSCS